MARAGARKKRKGNKFQHGIKWSTIKKMIAREKLGGGKK